MKSNNTVITLILSTKQEIEPGVLEVATIELKVKAIIENIYQRRLDQARINELSLTDRFKIRDYYENKISNFNLDYIIYKNKRYKTNSINYDKNGHYIIIETGEQL